MVSCSALVEGPFMRFPVRVRAIISMLALASVAIAHAPAASQAAPAPKPPVQWSIDWKSPYCMITTGDVKDAGISFWTVPGSNSVEIYIIGTAERVPRIAPGSPATIMLANGANISVPVRYPGPEWHGVLYLHVSDEEVLTKLGQATGISIEGASKEDAGKKAIIPIAGATKAMRVLQNCVDLKLPEWGIDPAGLRGLKERPKNVNKHPWLTSEDFPDSSFEVGKGGTAVARLTIDTSGRVSKCDIVHKSGRLGIDAAVCLRARQRARYKPAVGPDGRPVEASIIVYTSFKIFVYP